MVVQYHKQGAIGALTYSRVSCNAADGDEHVSREKNDLFPTAKHFSVSKISADDISSQRKGDSPPPEINQSLYLYLFCQSFIYFINFAPSSQWRSKAACVLSPLLRFIIVAIPCGR